MQLGREREKVPEEENREEIAWQKEERERERRQSYNKGEKTGGFCFIFSSS